MCYRLILRGVPAANQPAFAAHLQQIVGLPPVEVMYEKGIPLSVEGILAACELVAPAILSAVVKVLETVLPDYSSSCCLDGNPNAVFKSRLATAEPDGW